jgi:hypothetical protein
MSVFGDRGLLPRVSHLASRALVAKLKRGYLVIRRCAELADECRAAWRGVSHLQPFFEVIRQATNSADMELHYMHPDLQAVYIREIRPVLERWTQNLIAIPIAIRNQLSSACARAAVVRSSATAHLRKITALAPATPDLQFRRI